jgi:hypothetical protein
MFLAPRAGPRSAGSLPLPALHQLLAPEQVGDLARELAVEPGDQAADLAALLDRPAEQAGLRVGLVQVLRDRLAVADRPLAVGQHRHLARRVERQELLADAPGLGLDQLGRQPFSRSATLTLRENGQSGRW